MSERPDPPRDGMGVSSERVGKVRGSSEPATHGTEATGVAAEENEEPEGLNDDETGHN